MIKQFRLLWGLVCLVVGGCYILHAQNEGNIWYFGRYAGLDFNGGAPVALTDGALFTKEGCASISDNLGNLLFYTDGMHVWNRNHIVMPNGSGLLGHSSSSQSAIIVKKPGSSNIYMVFTVYLSAGTHGLRYSEVDITLDGGLGDINSIKNVLVVTPTCEKIAAVRHRNGVDFWIVTNLYGSDTFHSYLLTSSGLSSTPVVSNSGISIMSDSGTFGYLKASLSGDYIVAAYGLLGHAQLFDFDNTTGVISNPISFLNVESYVGWSGGYGLYGVEFSPDENLLYFSLQTSMGGRIYQYNLLAGTPADIIGSKTTVGILPTPYSGALQLGPDDKIYCALFNYDHIGVIHNPNSIGVLCNFQENGLYLNGGMSRAGLPTFYNTITNPFTISSSHFCMGDTTEFQITPTSLIDSVLWNFGDINSGSNNTSSMVNPQHQFSDTGRYTVTLVIDAFGISDTLYHDVYISPLPYVVLGSDSSLCTGETMILDATSANANYEWQDGSTAPTMQVQEPGGEYTVEVTVNGCGSKRDTIVVEYKPLPIVDIGEDTSLCASETILLDATNANTSASYEWQDGSTSSTMLVMEPGGEYWVEITANGCTGRDTVNATYPLPIIDIGEDTSLCIGETIILDVTSANANYKWQDGSTLSSMLVSEPGGEYWVEVTANDCSTSDTIVVDYNPLPIVNIREDTSLCAGETILLDATNANASASYEWQDGSTNATLHAAEPGGLYSVEVTVNGCTSSDVVEIEYLYAPDIGLGDDSVLCVGETILLDVTTPEASYLWSNGTTNASITVQEPAGQYWVHVASPCGVDSDTVYFEYEDCYCGFYIPNAFTPNDDGINDWFTPLHTCDPTKYQLQVFNRWGEMVFMTHNPSEGWNGFYKGKPAAPGAYAIVLSYLFDGDRYMNSEKGSIALIR